MLINSFKTACYIFEQESLLWLLLLSILRVSSGFSVALVAASEDDLFVTRPAFKS